MQSARAEPWGWVRRPDRLGLQMKGYARVGWKDCAGIVDVNSGADDRGTFSELKSQHVHGCLRRLKLHHVSGADEAERANRVR